MKIGALSLFGKSTLAHWHNPKSLTWRWILRFSRGAVGVKPYASVTRHEWNGNKISGFGAGLAGLIGFSAYRNNYGWQWVASLAFHHLSFQQQHSMWIKDLPAEPEPRKRRYQAPPPKRPEGVSLH